MIVTSYLNALKTSFRLMWDADRRSLVILIGINVFTALASVGELLALREVILALEDGNEVLSGLALPLAVLLGLLTLTSMLGIVGAELRLFANENVQRAVTLKTIDAANGASLAEFEDEEFHDLMQRASRGMGSRARVPAAMQRRARRRDSLSTACLLSQSRRPIVEVTFSASH